MDEEHAAALDMTEDELLRRAANGRPLMSAEAPPMKMFQFGKLMSRVQGRREQVIGGAFARAVSESSLRMAHEVADQMEAAGVEEDPDRPFSLRMEGGDFTRNEYRMVMTIPVRRR